MWLSAKLAKQVKLTKTISGISGIAARVSSGMTTFSLSISSLRCSLLLEHSASIRRLASLFASRCIRKVSLSTASSSSVESSLSVSEEILVDSPIELEGATFVSSEEISSESPSGFMISSYKACSMRQSPPMIPISHIFSPLLGFPSIH